MPALRAKKPGRPKKSNNLNFLAAIAHASFFIFPIFIPTILYVVVKNKSRFFKFQVIQALVFQFSYNIVMMVLSFSFVLGAVSPKLVFFNAPLLFIIYISSLLYSFYGTYQVAKGENFKYYLLGDFIEKKF